jgi:hypothetical protein
MSDIDDTVFWLAIDKMRELLSEMNEEQRQRCVRRMVSRFREHPATRDSFESFLRERTGRLFADMIGMPKRDRDRATYAYLGKLVYENRLGELKLPPAVCQRATNFP